MIPRNRNSVGLIFYQNFRSFYHQPCNRNENACSFRKFKFKYLCELQDKHALHQVVLPYAGLGYAGYPHAVAATYAGITHSSNVGICTNYVGAQASRIKRRYLQELKVAILSSLGPLLNSLHEDFLTEPISVLCHLNDKWRCQNKQINIHSNSSMIVLLFCFSSIDRKLLIALYAGPGPGFIGLESFL